ncbi:MAG TPA: hypothetical protein VMV37_00530, partial [Gammaproteobacteria bacterium]|nr:hypothetical protein [Gammaproteobacteria bacterium]
RFGILRLVGKLHRDEAASLPAELHARIEAIGQSPAFFRALSADINKLDKYDPKLRESGALGGLGDLPLVVITHGQPFPGPMATLEKYWGAGQERLAALSTDGELVVACNSNHMIQLDEPQVVIDAIRRVLDAAVRREPLTQARAAVHV